MKHTKIFRRTRKLIVVASFGLLLFGAINHPTMTAYAAEAAGPGVSTTQQSIQQLGRHRRYLASTQRQRKWLSYQFMVPGPRRQLVHARRRRHNVQRPRNRPVNRQELPAQHAT